MTLISGVLPTEYLYTEIETEIFFFFFFILSHGRFRVDIILHYSPGSIPTQNVCFKMIRDSITTRRMTVGDFVAYISGRVLNFKKNIPVTNRSRSLSVDKGPGISVPVRVVLKVSVPEPVLRCGRRARRRPPIAYRPQTRGHSSVTATRPVRRSRLCGHDAAPSSRCRSEVRRGFGFSSTDRPRNAAAAPHVAGAGTGVTDGTGRDGGGGRSRACAVSTPSVTSFENHRPCHPVRRLFLLRYIVIVVRRSLPPTHTHTRLRARARNNNRPMPSVPFWATWIIIDVCASRSTVNAATVAFSSSPPPPPPRPTWTPALSLVRYDVTIFTVADAGRLGAGGRIATACGRSADRKRNERRPFSRRVRTRMAVGPQSTKYYYRR